MEKLFGSKTRTKLLKMFMSNPNRSFFVREITRKIDEQINSVRRELANLLSLGVISSDNSNNKLYYEVDQKYEHYDALRQLFTEKGSVDTNPPKAAKSKSSVESVEKEDKDELLKAVDTPKAPMVDSAIWDKVGNIVGLLYSGVITRDSKSPVDVLIVGDVPVARAEAAVAELEKQEGRVLRYAVIDRDEWVYRSQVNDKFWSEVMISKNQIVLDKDSVFEK